LSATAFKFLSAVADGAVGDGAVGDGGKKF
jgi:hypothetical protein